MPSSDFEIRYKDILTMVIPQWLINPYDGIEETDILLQDELIGISTNEEFKSEITTFKLTHGYEQKTHSSIQYKLLKKCWEKRKKPNARKRCKWQKLIGLRQLSNHHGIREFRLLESIHETGPIKKIRVAERCRTEIFRSQPIIFTVIGKCRIPQNPDIKPTQEGKSETQKKFERSLRKK
ncbi:hypothetical protein TNCV_1533781 [Trichonephila clavipes]|nr:hypothetical protein TNCV_1533781 [Trichonephila clavipes]